MDTSKLRGQTDGIGTMYQLATRVWSLNSTEIGVNNRPDEPSTLGDRNQLFNYIVISFFTYWLLNQVYLQRVQRHPENLKIVKIDVLVSWCFSFPLCLGPSLLQDLEKKVYGDVFSINKGFTIVSFCLATETVETRLMIILGYWPWCCLETIACTVASWKD